jgi:hypothetical protein
MTREALGRVRWSGQDVERLEEFREGVRCIGEPSQRSGLSCELVGKLVVDQRRWPPRRGGPSDGKQDPNEPEAQQLCGTSGLGCLRAC